MAARSPNLDREHLELLLEAARVLGSSLEVQAVVDGLMAQTVRVIGAERGFVLLEGERVAAWHGLSPEDTRRSEFSISRGVVDAVQAERQTVLTSDALHDERFRDQASVGLHALRSILCVPLLARSGQMLGVLYADNRLQTAAFGKREKDLLEAVAAQAAAALENALLYDELRRVHETSMERARRELAETQAQLMQASKMTAVGQLAAGVAHELNNPLGAIALQLSSLNNRIQEPDLRKRMGIVDAAVQRCKSIVERLLRFSHKGTGQGSIFEVLPLALDVAALVEPELRHCGVRLDLRIAPQMLLQGEPQEVSQTLLNLILNARDGGARNVVVEGAGQVLEVRDDGSGMSEEVLRRACEPFFTTKPVGKGVGLGLALTYQMMHARGGRLDLDSAPGRGTTVRLTWPSRS